MIENGSAVIRLSSVDGRKLIFPTIEREWVFHPAGDDLAVYSPEAETFGVMGFRFNFIRRGDIIDQSTIVNMNIGPGDDAFIVGRFINHEGRQRNLPTVRFGCIGQMPSEPIPQDRGCGHSPFMQESFLVEARSIGGYSGSPVFVHIGRYNSGVGRHNTNWEYGPWLLGVDWGHVNDWIPVCDASGKPINPGRPRDMQVRTNTGMMAVVPGWKLAELLDNEKFIEERRIATEKLREEEMANPSPPTTQD